MPDPPRRVRLQGMAVSSPARGRRNQQPGRGNRRPYGLGIRMGAPIPPMLRPHPPILHNPPLGMLQWLRPLAPLQIRPRALAPAVHRPGIVDPPIFPHQPVGIPNQPRPPAPAVADGLQAIMQNRPRAPAPAIANGVQDIHDMLLDFPPIFPQQPVGILNQPRPPAPAFANGLPDIDALLLELPPIYPRQDFDTTGLARFLGVGADSTEQLVASLRRSDRIDSLFKLYAKKSRHMRPKGMVNLYSDLRTCPTDIKRLLFAWKMNAERPGCISLDEWQRGLTALEAHTIPKLRKQLIQLENSANNDMPDFEDFYKFVFHFNIKENKDTVSIQTVCQLLRTIFGVRYPDRVEKFTVFLSVQKECRCIDEGQWFGFLRFCREVNFPSLDNYVADDKWPALLVDFVEWLRKEQAGSSSSAT